MAGAKIFARFGASVRNFRFRLGVSQEELAHRAGLHRTYIAGIEGGARNVTLRSIDKLARALGVPIPVLLSTLDESSNEEAVKTKFPAGHPVEILLVEDNPDDVELTLNAFREARIANHVHVAADGDAALEFLLSKSSNGARQRKLPQVILLDLNLPKISGLEVLRRIKLDPRTRNIPVVVLTISQNSRDIETSRRLGAVTYIVKPVDFQNFSRVTPELSMQWALLQPASEDR